MDAQTVAALLGMILIVALVGIHFWPEQEAPAEGNINNQFADIAKARRDNWQNRFGK